jgi:O-antigen ligase
MPMLAGPAIALAGAALLVDPGASAAFDAPKRLALVVGAVTAACCWLWLPPASARPVSATARRIAWLACSGLIVATLAAVLAPRPPDPASLRADAALVLLAVFAAGVRWNNRLLRQLGIIAATLAALNLAFAAAQIAGWISPLPSMQAGGRTLAGALLGNEGYVALTAALAGSAAFACMLRTATPRARAVALVAVLGCALVIVGNRQVTAAIAAAAAIGTVALLAMRGRSALLLALAAGAVIVGGLLAAGLRDAPPAPESDSRITRLQQLTTYRLGAQLAAWDMTVDAPWTGQGAGRYAALAQPYRLSAELRLHERLLPPPTGHAHVHAHNDYLEAAAEHGVPAAALMIAAGLMLLAALARLARRSRHAEPLVLLALLFAGAVAALAWFPLHIPHIAAALALAVGRGWRLVADDDPGHAQ